MKKVLDSFFFKNYTNQKQMNEGLIDYAKFSQTQMEEIFESHKLATKAAEQEKSVAAEKDCQVLKAALQQLINQDFYSELKRNKTNAPIQLSSNRYFLLESLDSLSMIKSKCNVDFKDLSDELSVATKSKVTVTLFQKRSFQSEHFLELTSKKNQTWDSNPEPQV
jgi:hypothetical protein